MTQTQKALTMLYQVKCYDQLETGLCQYPEGPLPFPSLSTQLYQSIPIFNMHQEVKIGATQFED